MDLGPIIGVPNKSPLSSLPTLTAFFDRTRDWISMTDPQNDALNKIHQPVPESEKILGRAPGTPGDEVSPADVPTLDPSAIRPEWKGYYEKLIDKRDQLLDQEKAAETRALENQPDFITQIADAGTDSYMRDFDLGLATHDSEMATEVQAALQRLADGTYGICEVTGKPIPPERLEAVPWTRFSAAVEEQFEKRGEEPLHAEFHSRGALNPRDVSPNAEDAA